MRWPWSATPKLANVVACSDCHVLIEQKHAQRVESRSAYYYLACGVEELFYCGRCKKPYDSVTGTVLGRAYFRQMAVDKEGIPLGYARITLQQHDVVFPEKKKK